jgi:hypothetical protein
MSDVHRVQVLLRTSEAERFERFCMQRGYKKSTLIARLIREHLDHEGFESPSPALRRRAAG